MIYVMQSHDKMLEQLQNAVEDKERLNREKVISSSFTSIFIY
jgi:hypothetical protein